MNVLSAHQVQDLLDLRQLCERIATDVVIIGAVAYRIFIDDPYRETADIDLAVALDLRALPGFEESLSAAGWKRSERLEHRWLAKGGSIVDLLPAGESLLAQGQIEWPRSGLVMSLSGFRHVFSGAKEIDVGGGVHFRVVPPPIQALMKMGSYLDDPYGRKKDLGDFRRLLQKYEAESERIFSDAVFDANLPDIFFVPAFLLGYDLRGILTENDRHLIERFIAKTAELLAYGPATDFDGHDTKAFRGELAAFEQGLHTP